MREYVLSYDDIEVLMNKRAITIPESQGSNRSEISTYIFHSIMIMKNCI